jgi:tetratricopeptide (TPR) repeat protein
MDMKVEGVYGKLSTRINTACWRELFNEEVCRDFDTFAEVREAFLVFLMDHFRFSEEVWRLIEESFQLVDSKEELYEKFPVNFVDFITEDAEKKGWMDYTLFEGDDEADIDEFINLYLSLRRMNDSNQYDELKEVSGKLKQINLWHPYLEAEKIRCLIVQKRLKEAERIAEKLRLKKVEDLCVKYYIAELYLESGDLESAYVECDAILKAHPEHFGAKSLLCAFYLKKEEYEEAKKRYLELLEMDNYNMKLQEGLQKSNIGLIKAIKEQLKEEPDNKALRLELAWCFFQNGSIGECMTLTDNMEIDSEIYYDYYNLMSRAYLALDDYEKGFLCTQRWLTEILKTRDDGSLEAQKRLKRLGLAYYFMARCLYNFGTAKEDKREDFQQCIHYIDLAVQAEQNKTDVIQFLAVKAQVLLELKEDKQCIDICDEIIRTDKGYYPAYLLRQEAYFNLRMAQEVIDDYFNAVGIYPQNARPYIFAANVYLIYRRYDDAAEVIKRSREAGVESNELLFLELKYRRLKACSNEERKVVAAELDSLYNRAQQEAGDLKEITDLLHELALCYYDMDENERALKVIEKKISLRRTCESMMLKGDILYYLKKYKEGIALYKAMLMENPNISDAYYKMGLCCNGLGWNEEALDSFLKALGIDQEHPFANGGASKIYKKRIENKFTQEDYRHAVEYAKRQVEINPSCYYYTGLGLIYLEGYEMDEAIKAFEEAVKYDSANPYPYNNIGYAYKILGDFEKAHEYYQKAIEHMDREDLLLYWNMADYYRITGQYEKAIETYKMIAVKSNNPIPANKSILGVYKQMKAWDLALQKAKSIFISDRNGGMDYLLESGDICSFAGNDTEALQFYKLAIQRFPAKSKPYIKMGDYMLWAAGAAKKALNYYTKAYKVSRKYDYDPEGELNSLQNIVSALKELGNEKKGIRYVKKMYLLFNKLYGSLEGSIVNPGKRKIRLFYIALWHFNTGQYWQVFEYINLMRKSLNCAQCKYRICYEYLELEGKMLEMQKDYPGALEKYQKALNAAPANLHYMAKIKELKEKTGAR